MRRIFNVFVLFALALSVSAAHAAEKTKIRFTLDWKLQGIHAWYFWAQEKGYFAAENLDVTIDQGEGSAATINTSSELRSQSSRLSFESLPARRQ